MIKSRAIVLHRFAYSDSSWIVKALTEESGIISFIVKGGKRKDSPFRGALDPLALCEVVFRENPNTELQFIKEATLIDWRKNLREDLLSLAKAQVMAEMVLRYAPQGVPLQEEFILLEQATSELDASCTISATNVICDNRANYTAATQEANSEEAFQAKPSYPFQTRPSEISEAMPSGFQGTTSTLSNYKNNIFAQWLLSTCEMWGYDLDLGTCSRCGRALENAAADFSPETGGIICKSCLGIGTPRARSETLSGLWALHRNIEMRQPRFAENALLAYLRAHIGFLKEINALQFLNETRKLFGE